MMAAESNADYSSGVVTPVQRSKFVPMTGDGQWGASARDGAEVVESAHDRNALPDVAYRAPLSNNRSSRA